MTDWDTLLFVLSISQTGIFEEGHEGREVRKINDCHFERSEKSFFDELRELFVGFDLLSLAANAKIA